MSGRSTTKVSPILAHKKMTTKSVNFLRTRHSALEVSINSNTHGENIMKKSSEIKTMESIMRLRVFHLVGFTPFITE